MFGRKKKEKKETLNERMEDLAEATMDFNTLSSIVGGTGENVAGHKVDPTARKQFENNQVKRNG